MGFQKATRTAAKARVLFTGQSKAGKTYSSMAVMNALVGPGNWAVLDTENGSASKYAADADGKNGFLFDVLVPETHHPSVFVKAIVEAVQAGYKGLIIDSLSHEWVGKGGCLELVDKLTKDSRSANSFQQWGEVTPQHNKVFEAINRAPIHIFCTLRVKMEYAIQENDRGKKVPVKIGLAPVTRDGVEYEFDVLMEMDKGVGRIDHTSRCPDLQNVVVKHPGEQIAQVLSAWLEGKPSPIKLNEEIVIEEQLTKGGIALELPKKTSSNPSTKTSQTQDATAVGSVTTGGTGGTGKREAIIEEVFGK